MNNNSVKEVIVTLYEGHYHLGVAALINSAEQSKFSGLVYVGYRGSLPPWINQLINNDNGYQTKSGLRIHFEELKEVQMHFGYYKPHIVKRIFSDFATVNNVFYFDPDIVINSEWSFFSSWVQRGVALCVDGVFDFIHHTHPWRHEWRQLGASISTEYNQIDFFVNAGFFGVRRENLLFAEHWIKLTELYKNSGRSVTKYEQHLANFAIKSDQDLLNAIVTITPGIEYSIIGKEGMGFVQPAYLMSHAIGDGIKPWKRNFIKTLLVKGWKPTVAEEDFIKYCNYPIKPFKSSTLYLKKMNLKLSKVVGRFWSV